MKKTQQKTLERIAILAMLSAIALVLFLFEIPLLPSMSHLKLSPSDIPALFAAVAYGPVFGVIVEFVKNLLELVIKGMGTQMGFGNIMDFLVGCAYIVPFALIYRKRKTNKAMLIACLVSTASIIVIGLCGNYVIAPLFFKYFLGIELDSASLWAAISAATIQNTIKGILLSLISYPLIKVLMERLEKYIR